MLSTDNYDLLRFNNDKEAIKVASSPEVRIGPRFKDWVARMMAVPERTAYGIVEPAPPAVTVTKAVQFASPDLPTATELTQHPSESPQAMYERTVNLGGYSSNTLIDAIEHKKIQKLSNGKLNLVALFGSTHDQAQWRENSVIDFLRKINTAFFNPKMKEWNYKLHPKAESTAMSEAAVLAFRLENKDIKNGSLASLIEFGDALLLAVLTGQKIVVSIEPGIESSFESPEAKRLYAAFLLSIELAQQEYSQYLQFDQSGEIGKFEQMIESALADQRNPEKCLQPLSKERLLATQAKREQTMLEPNREILVGGATRPYDKDNEKLLGKFRRKIGSIVKLLENREISNDAKKAPRPRTLVQKMTESIPLLQRWEKAEENPRIFQYESVLESEVSDKNTAQSLVWLVTEECAGGIASLEAAQRALFAIMHGQPAALLVEAFNPNPYVNIKLRKEAGEMDKQLDMLIAQHQPSEEDIQIAKRIIAKLLEGEYVSFKEVKSAKLLTQTEQFKTLDNINRPRAVAFEQSKKIQKEIARLSMELGYEIVIVDTDYDHFIQRLGIFSDKERIIKSQTFWKNFRTLKSKLDQLVLTLPPQPDEKNAVGLIRNEVINLAVENESLPGLLRHSADVQNSGQGWQKLLEKNGGTTNSFLSSRQFWLLNEVIAPLHDIIKPLGLHQGQDISQHEMMIKYVLEVYLPKMGFTDPDDLHFIAEIIGDHENIYKEEGRDIFVNSENPEERGKSLFFIMDTLTGVVSSNEQDESGRDILKIDESTLKSRFQDLYFRHIDLAAGKTFRPEWGVSALKEYIQFFSAMEKRGFVVEKAFYNKLFNSVAAAINEAGSQNGIRLISQSKKVNENTFDPDQLERIRITSSELDRFKTEFEANRLN